MLFKKLSRSDYRLSQKISTLSQNISPIQSSPVGTCFWIVEKAHDKKPYGQSNVKWCRECFPTQVIMKMRWLMSTWMTEFWTFLLIVTIHHEETSLVLFNRERILTKGSELLEFGHNHCFKPLKTSCIENNLLYVSGQTDQHRQYDLM